MTIKWFSGGSERADAAISVIDDILTIIQKMLHFKRFY